MSDLARLQAEISELRAQVQELKSQTPSPNRLSLIVFSGSYDRMLSSFILATGAAAQGMEVEMFFTFWGTSALRDPHKSPSRNGFIEKMMGFMMPQGIESLPLSQFNFLGAGPAIIRRLLGKNGTPSLSQMFKDAQELGVKITICEMSMSLLGIQREEITKIENLEYVGVATFLERSTKGTLTLFI